MSGWSKLEERVDLFLFSPALSELGLSGVHALLLAFPHPSESLLSLDLLTSIWKEAELLVKEGVAETVGVADLDKGQLEELYEWAEVKPKVNQVNLAHCCTIPEVGGAIVAMTTGKTVSTLQ